MKVMAFNGSPRKKDWNTVILNTAVIYTMNVTEEQLEQMGLNRHFGLTKMMLEVHFGACELLLCTDTMQYSDYDKYELEMFDKEAKAKRHAEVFPEDCKRAFELGVRMASGEVSEPEPMAMFS